MATNEIRTDGVRMRLIPTAPTPVANTTPASGAPCLYGARPGVADTTADANGACTIHFGGVYNLSVKGINGGGNSAVNNGDAIYYTDGDTPKLSKKATGTLFGYATAEPYTTADPLVASAGTATIAVKIAAT